MEKADEATTASEEDSSVEVKEEPTDEMRDFAENTMNELLGWYGYDKVDETDTQGLRLNHFNKTMQETLARSLESGGASRSSSSSTEQQNPSKHREKSCQDHSKPTKHTHHSRDKPTSSPLRPIAPSVPTVVPIVGVYAGSPRPPPSLGNALTMLRNSKDSRTLISDEPFSVSDGQLPEKQIVCAWCQQFGMKRYTLNTSSESKAFCSEKCFAACRRAYFKRNKVCDWCKHVRHTKEYLDYGGKDRRLQFCSIKCLNQYKMDIFCKETQASLPPGSPLGPVLPGPPVAVPTSPIDITKGLAVTNGSPQIITQDSWGKSPPESDKQNVLVNCGGGSVVQSPGHELLSVTSPSDQSLRTESVIQSGQVLAHAGQRKRHLSRHKLNPTLETHPPAAPLYPESVGHPGSSGHNQHPQPHIIVTNPPGVPQHQPQVPQFPPGVPPQNFSGHRPPHPNLFPFPPHGFPLPHALHQFQQRFPFLPQVDGSQINIPPATLMVPYPVIFPVPIPIPIPIPIFRTRDSREDVSDTREDVSGVGDSPANSESKDSVDDGNSADLEEHFIAVENTESELEGEHILDKVTEDSKKQTETKMEEVEDITLNEETQSSRKRKSTGSEEVEDPVKRILIELSDTEEEGNRGSTNKVKETANSDVETEKCIRQAVDNVQECVLSAASVQEEKCAMSATTVDKEKGSSSATSVEAEKDFSSAASVEAEKCLSSATSVEKGKLSSHMEMASTDEFCSQKTESSSPDERLESVPERENLNTSNGILKSEAGECDEMNEKREMERTEKAEESKRVNSEHAYAASPIEEPMKESPRTREKRTPTPTNSTHKVVSDHAYALRRSGRLATDHHSVGVTTKAEKATNPDTEPPVKRRSLRSRSKVH